MSTGANDDSDPVSVFLFDKSFGVCTCNSHVSVFSHRSLASHCVEGRNGLTAYVTRYVTYPGAGGGGPWAG